MSTRMRVLQVLLGFVCVSHLFFGVVAFMGASGPVQAIAARFYGADLDMNAQLLHVIRMLGAFMLAMAVLSGLGAFRPQQSGPIVIGLVVLLCCVCFSG